MVSSDVTADDFIGCMKRLIQSSVEVLHGLALERLEEAFRIERKLWGDSHSQTFGETHMVTLERLIQSSFEVHHGLALECLEEDC